MIYNYKILVQYEKGGTSFIKEYIKSFLEIGEFFVWLEKKHKNNYTLISIKEYLGGFNYVYSFTR